MKLQWFNNIKGEQECKAKYKALMKEHHPDKHKTEYNKKLANAKTQSINGEFQWLKDNDWNKFVAEEPIVERRSTKARESKNKWGDFFKTYGANTVVDDVDENVDWKDATNYNFNPGYVKYSSNIDSDYEEYSKLQDICRQFLYSIKNVNDERNKIKIIALSVLTHWIIEGRNPTPDDFKRLGEILNPLDRNYAYKLNKLFKEL